MIPDSASRGALRETGKARQTAKAGETPERPIPCAHVKRYRPPHSPGLRIRPEIFFGKYLTGKTGRAISLTMLKTEHGKTARPAAQNLPRGGYEEWRRKSVDATIPFWLIVFGMDTGDSLCFASSVGDGSIDPRSALDSRADAETLASSRQRLRGSSPTDEANRPVATAYNLGGFHDGGSREKPRPNPG